MGVMMQAFHWDCPREDNREFAWWPFVRDRIPALATVGFTSLWLPPVHKAANIGGASMGYDPYDYYDLGEFDQKGSVKTWFGSRQELADLIEEAHGHGMSVLADMVLNHNSGADAEEVNPITSLVRWTKFKPKSGKFARDWECFHPCPYETWDDGTFGDMPDLSHRNPYVFGEILKLAQWLVEEIGFDGFRYDFVKGYGTWIVTAIQEYRYLRNGLPFKPYGVGENWDGARTIDNWINETNAWNDNPVDAFDFPLMMHCTSCKGPVTPRRAGLYLSLTIEVTGGMGPGSRRSGTTSNSYRLPGGAAATSADPETNGQKRMDGDSSGPRREAMPSMRRNRTGNGVQASSRNSLYVFQRAQHKPNIPLYSMVTLFTLSPSTGLGQGSRSLRCAHRTG